MRSELQSYGHAKAVLAVFMLLIFSVLYTPYAVNADNKLAPPLTVEFYHVYIPGLLEKDGKTGALAEAIYEIGNRANIKFVMLNVPVKRQDRALLGDKVVVAGPALDVLETEDVSFSLRTSLPIAYRRDFAFVRKGTTIPASIEATKTMKLVTSPTTSLPPPIAQLHGSNILETHSDQSAITLLSKGRVDLWVNDETSTLAALAGSGVNNITYNPDTPLHEWPARMLFSKACDDALIERIDAAIQSMIDDGTMHRLLPNNYSKAP